MSRATIVINSGNNRARARELLDRVPLGTRVEFKGARRTLPQNDRLWAMLTDISQQKEHADRIYSKEVWKALFLEACFHQKTLLVPTLDNKGLITCQTSSRDLSKEEMSELIEFIQCWCAEHGVILKDNESEAA